MAPFLNVMVFSISIFTVFCRWLDIFLLQKENPQPSINIKAHTYSLVIDGEEALVGYLMPDNVENNIQYFFTVQTKCQIMVVTNGANPISAIIFLAAFRNFNLPFTTRPTI